MLSVSANGNPEVANLGGAQNGAEKKREGTGRKAEADCDEYAYEGIRGIMGNSIEY
jgi:hypothetical protein